MAAAADRSRRRGDWAQTVAAEPGGWYFEYANEFYPDVRRHGHGADGAATQFADAARGTSGHCRRSCAVRAAMAAPPATARRHGGDSARIAELAAIDRGLRWLLAMQNRDGGWGAFDRNNNRQFLCYVPFADHNAMIDPSTPDLAGRVLEALGQLGRRVGRSGGRSGGGLPPRSQEADGSWFGRWGVNYIYGTWQALTGLAAVGVPADDPAVAAGAPIGSWPISSRAAAGANRPTATQIPRLARPRPADRLANGLGRDGTGGRRPGEHPAVVRGDSLPGSMHAAADGTWEEPRIHRHRLSAASFTCAITTIPSIFRLLALSQWAAKATDASECEHEDALGLPGLARTLPTYK